MTGTDETAAPNALLRRVATQLREDYDQEHDASHLSWQDFAGQAERLIALIRGHDDEWRARIHQGGRGGKPLPERVERCMSHRPHDPHVAHWHNDVETLCDGMGRP